jgi:hypothetical protein
MVLAPRGRSKLSATKRTKRGRSLRFFGLIVLMRCCCFAVALESCVETINRAAKVWDRYRTSDHERDIKQIEKLGPCYSRRNTLFDVVGNAVVTAKHYRRNQTKHFLSPFVECTVFISLRVEREKALEAKMIAAEQLFVHVRPIAVEFIHRKPFITLPLERPVIVAIYNSRPFYPRKQKVAIQ